ncbi:protein unc-80 homolog isoform X4 [Sitophilus oryzae]|uniref:Protein unc-80 homolog isoform X4 n=1 Tax=Sitophilus oryzae TaxID=7048 RepID=A0A6J2Y5X8_SITOR|nr:protein unc-80 homolog isoform X4 [Sitophilus oryzae]
MHPQERDAPGETILGDMALPIPIQIFLWRQVSPFVRPKLGKLHEASCMFCQHAITGHHELKEACKIFEKVLVQNLFSGLKKDLTEAVKTIPRWRLIQAALPHVMHSVQSVLYNRMKDGNLQSLGAVETKLLYTLHWILLDAADECADADYEKGIFHYSQFHYLFSVPTITLFVYLFAPLCQNLKESDFQNFRLENGLKIWQPMWEFRHPEAPCFIYHCKPKPKFFHGKSAKWKTQCGDVFMGKHGHVDTTMIGRESPTLSQQVSASSSDQQHAFSGIPPTTVTVTATITTKSEDEAGWVSSPKDTVFPETIPEESSSTEEEHVVIFRLPSLHESDGFLRDPSVYTAETSIIQLAMRRNGRTNNINKSLDQTSSTASTDSKSPRPPMQKIGSSTDKDSVDSGEKKPEQNEQSTKFGSHHIMDLTAATFLDVGVLRCLFITHWQEEGIYWALHFLYNRLRDISEETAAQHQPRKRSNSLPIPKIEVSFYQNSETKKTPENKDFIEVPDPRDVTLLPESPTESPYTHRKQSDDSLHKRAASEKGRRRMKIADLKAFVETKLLSKSDKALEKIGQEDPKPLDQTQPDYHRSLDTSEDMSKKNSGLSKSYEPIPSNLVKGKSMPSLSCLIDEINSEGFIEESRWDARRTSKSIHAQPMANPIITVTEHTPTPSPDYLRRQGSIDSQIDGASLSGRLGNWQERKSSLTRSQTDSNITYTHEDIPEAPGATCYITKEGDIDFNVVLKGVYRTSLRESTSCTLRVLEVILNLLELLIDMGILKQTHKEEHQPNYSGEDQETPKKTEKEKVSASNTHTSFPGDTMSNEKYIPPHTYVMSTIVRVLKHLGCPHGCADGQRGPAAEFLRTQCQNILSRLHKSNQKLFKKFLRDFVKFQPLTEILEVLHAYLGYCIDPTSLLSPLTLGGTAGVRGIESHVVSHCFKPLVTRFVEASKEIRSHDNMSLYCEIRQLMTYVKEGHGGSFRRVALSALLDTAEKNSKKEGNIQTTRVIRHMHQSSANVDDNDTIDNQGESTTYTIDDKGVVRKLLFKKRSTSSTCASLLETETEEFGKANQSPLGNLRKKHHILTPRQSEKALGIVPDTISLKSTKKSKIGGIVTNWFKKGDSQSVDECEMPDNGDSFNDTASFISFRQSSKHYQQRSSRGHVSHTLQKAKRRMEDKLKFLKKGKKKDGSMEESGGGSKCFSRRNSFEIGETSRESEVVFLKERKLIPTGMVYNGTQRLAFLLETCPPGTVPDAFLLASALDLPNSAMVARATLFLECAYFVHCCNKGQWPSWMKLSFPMFRPSGPLPTRGSSHSGNRRSHIMQRAAGKMFHQWAEVIGHRLEEMINADQEYLNDMHSMVNDPDKQKELQIQDEEEDYLDEASIYSYGSNCPMPLRLIACVLLQEITAFLRETYQTLPKTCKSAGKERPPPWEKFYSKEANRRWSMALSSMGHSQTSAQSLQSITGDRDPTLGQAERKISFVLHEPEPDHNESEASSNATVTMQASQNPEDGKKSQGRPYLLRRGTAAPSGGSFKRRSLKLRRGTKEGKDMEMEWRIQECVKRTDSIQSKRKVSSLSDRSDTSEPGATGEVSGEESPGILSDDQPPESPTDSNDADDTPKNMPWLKVMVQISNGMYFYCNHQNFCHPFCHRRVMRGCSRLIKAVRKVYGEEFGVIDDKFVNESETKKKSNKKDKNNRKVSDQTSSQVSPIRRKDSVGKRDRIDKNLDGSQASKLASKDSSRDIADSDGGNSCSKNVDDGRPTEAPPILKYIQSQVKDAYHAPLATLLKGAVILTEENFSDIVPVAWELLLEMNQEVAAAAASLFILSAVKAPSQVTEIMQHGLTNTNPAIRINAILRFQVLWKLRFQVWPRMEENAHVLFKIPPPGIEFTLPSPKIGIESLDVVDSPWELLVKTKVEEVTINQERHRSLVTATKTRKKQQTELIKMALQAQDDKKREARENFLITTIPITIQAAHEPSLYHTSEEHEDDDDQPDGQTRNTGHHLHSAHSLFPSCLCSAVVSIINLLDDAAVSADGCAVYEVAYSVIWTCLVEDSALFLRYILERLTRDQQEQMFKILRHLIRFIPKLPQQAAFALYNYIIGYVMFYVRSPHEEGQQLIGSALSLLWMVVHSVHGIMFKDLKQILRKEQCDASILLTANVPSAKKIIVHGPQDPDAGGIPTQFQVNENTQFWQILKEALDFFRIEESKKEEYFLTDYKTHQIRNPSAYVRDYYFFKRSQYPQLELVHMEPEEGFHALQKEELVHKFVESGKVLLTWAILKNVDMVVQRVVFLHEELIKLPSFPRKALESNLDLYKSGPLGKELLGLDVLHKFMWVRLIARMFEAMAGNFAYSGDIHLFVNVLNGALILHTEDACILRYVMATYINAAFHFKNIFSTNGYLLIMPTLLKIYSNHQTNKLVTTTIEYAVKEFYTMNRKPFILQMFGSVSAMLDTDEEGMYGNAHKIQSSCLFNLLLSLETPSPDPLNIAELVKEPVKAIDFCYHDEDNDVTVLDCISMCVMVVSYSAESCRGYQMMVILEAILPYYVDKIQNSVYIANSIKRFKKNERDIINQLSIAVRCLIENCSELTKFSSKRVYNGPHRSSPEHKGSSQRNFRGPYSPGFDFEDDSHSKFMSEHNRTKSMYENDTENSEVQRAEYRRPRDVLLSLVGEFVLKVNERIAEIMKKDTDGKTIEVLDCRSHVRLADIAHALLKVSPYDPESMACRGLQYYMSYVLPATDWGDDAMRPAFVTLLKRLEKVFSKIQKKPSIRRNTDWDAAAGLLKGVYNTMIKYPYIINWHQIKQLVTVCQCLIVTECCVEGVSGATAALLSQAPPPNFCSMVVRLIALQIQDGQEFCTLETVCGGSTFPTQEKTESVIINLIMPLCLRVGSGRKDVPKIKPSDVSFAITLVLHAMSPPNIKAAAQSGPNPKGTAETRTGSLTFTGTRDTKTASKINTSLYEVSFLALKMIAICFEEHLINDWIKIGRTMRELGKRNEAATFLWDFLDFVVTHRTPLYILMQPFIFLKLAQPPISDFERNMHQRIRDKIRSIGLPLPKSKGAILMELATRMKKLKEELSGSTEAEESRKENPQTNVHITSEIQRPQRQSMISGLLPSWDHHQRSSTHEYLHSHLKGSSTSISHASTPVQKTTGTTEEPCGSTTLCNTQGSSTSTSHASTPIQKTTGTSEETSGGTTPCNAQDRSSQRSSTSDEAHPTNYHHPINPQPNHHPPSTTHKTAHKLRFVSSVEFKHSSGETSLTPLSPSSPVEEEEVHQKSRLQRMMPQSRKTFRLRSKSRSKKSSELSHLKLDSELDSPPGPQTFSPPPVQTPTQMFPNGLQIDSSTPYTPLPNETPSLPTSPQVSTPPANQSQSGHQYLHQQYSNQSNSGLDNQKVGFQNQNSFSAIDSHRLRIATRGKSAEGSWDEDSAISQTSSTSGYRESYPVMHLKDTLETSPKTFPPLASPDLHSLPSTSSAATNNFLHIDNSSPDCSLNDNCEKTALLDQEDQSSSKDSLLIVFDQETQDETTLI